MVGRTTSASIEARPHVRSVLPEPDDDGPAGYAQGQAAQKVNCVIRRQRSGCVGYLIRKSFLVALPPLVAATIQRGMRPRPVHVFDGFFGSRYFGAILPFE